MFSSRKVRAEDAWEGVVIDTTRRATDGSNLYHYVEVRRPDGKTRKFRIEKDLWETLSPGDRLVKEPGTSAPVRD